MLCAPLDTLTGLKWKGKEEDSRGSEKKGRAEADLWGRHGGDRFPEKWEEILNDRLLLM